MPYAWVPFALNLKPGESVLMRRPTVHFDREMLVDAGRIAV
jgi:hypothetical protein